MSLVGGLCVLGGNTEQRPQRRHRSARNAEQKGWIGTPADLVFCSNSQLSALAEAYATANAESAVVDAFIAACTNAMMLDRFEIQ